MSKSLLTTAAIEKQSFGRCFIFGAFDPTEPARKLRRSVRRRTTCPEEDRLADKVWICVSLRRMPPDLIFFDGLNSPRLKRSVAG